MPHGENGREVRIESLEERMLDLYDRLARLETKMNLIAYGVGAVFTALVSEIILLFAVHVL